jgi:hypothetical protein
LHSSAQGAAAIRGGRTRRDGTASSPASAISLTPRGKFAEVATTAARSSKVARLQTNSPVSSMKTSESLRPSLENSTIGGSSDTALKNE